MAMNDPPPISEDDINRGMIGLLNKGIIPKDVDLTPAFEKGAPPVTCKGIKFYDKREQNVKRERILCGKLSKLIKLQVSKGTADFYFFCLLYEFKNNFCHFEIPKSTAAF